MSAQVPFVVVRVCASSNVPPITGRAVLVGASLTAVTLTVKVSEL